MGAAAGPPSGRLCARRHHQEMRDVHMYRVLHHTGPVTRATDVMATAGVEGRTGLDPVAAPDVLCLERVLPRRPRLLIYDRGRYL